jgi:hypothetical protein
MRGNPARSVCSGFFWPLCSHLSPQVWDRTTPEGRVLREKGESDLSRFYGFFGGRAQRERERENERERF